MSFRCVSTRANGIAHIIAEKMCAADALGVGVGELFRLRIAVTLTGGDSHNSASSSARPCASSSVPLKHFIVC